MNHIVLHIPHSSPFIEPNRLTSDFVNPDVVMDGVNYLTDWFVDDLFKPTNARKEFVSPVIFQHSRFVCDVERFFDNTKEPMYQKGNGYCYTMYEGTPIRQENYELINVNKLYIDHHNYLRDMIIYKTEKPYDTLLLDCHSFSSDIDPMCDINIGFNENSDDCPSIEFITMVRNYFENECHLKVGINEPFEGSIQLKNGGDVAYRSMMIEVNKRLYMDEVKFEKYSDFYKINHIINKLYGKILTYNLF